MNIREGFIQPGSAPQPAPQQDAKTIEHQASTPTPGIPPSPGPPPPEIQPSPAETPDRISAFEQWPKICKIMHRPIFDEKGQPIKEIKLREPRAADINRWGNPCRLTNEGEIIIEERKMTYMISALSGILPIVLEGLDPRDWNSAAYRLRPFFVPELEAWS